jgi:hypothetical protein
LFVRYEHAFDDKQAPFDTAAGRLQLYDYHRLPAEPGLSSGSL